MKYLIEDENFLTEEEKKYLTDKFEEIPFYYNKRIGIYRRDAPVMVHNLVLRFDDSNTPKGEDRTNSPYAEFFLKILLRFTKKYNLEFTKVLRGAINITTKVKWDKTIVHVDHDPMLHSVFMLYLGEGVHGNLNLYEDDKKTLIKSVVPKNFKIVCFGDNVPHQFIYPTEGLRRAVVFTFN